MKIFPAIDLLDGKAVRLLKGDYNKVTVYDDDPVNAAKKFEALGAEYIHIVDLNGAKTGLTPNMDFVKKIVLGTKLFTEIGGGIRDEETVEKYFSMGVGRVILGTAAVQDEDFLCRAVEKYGEKIAVGIDVSDGFVAIKGWTQVTQITCFEFFEKMEKLGVKTVICTDISKDGALRGTNIELYRLLSEKFSLNLTASGGITSMDDVKALAKLKIYGAIIGRAYYDGAIDLREAIEAAR